MGSSGGFGAGRGGRVEDIVGRWSGGVWRRWNSRRALVERGRRGCMCPHFGGPRLGILF